jgi:hypothetical protein
MDGKTIGQMAEEIRKVNTILTCRPSTNGRSSTTGIVRTDTEGGRYEARPR